MIRSSNPALRPGVFTGPDVLGLSRSREDVMTVEGTTTKAMILLALAAVSGAWAWSRMINALQVTGELPMVYLFTGLFGGFVVAMVTVFVKKIAAYTAPIYALLEGLALGSLSLMLDLRYKGIATQAVLATGGVFAVMLVLYRSKLIPVTDKLRIGIAAATGGIMLVYLASMVLGFFGTTIPYIHASGGIGIGFSLLVVGIAAFNLLLNFDFIEEGSRSGAPKFMEWYGAFGLMVTLVWLYVEILSLLAKLRDRR